MPELEGDGAVMTGDSAKDGEDVGDPPEDGEVIGVPADGVTASLLSLDLFSALRADCVLLIYSTYI